MARNTLYSELKQYILRKLGSPVINIEITDDQLEDCIDEAVKEFVENHSCGVNVGFIPLTLEQDVIEYELDDNVQAVLNILSTNNITLDADDPLLIKTFYVGNTLYDMYRPDLIDVEVFRQTFKLVEQQFDIPILFDFNATTKKLILHAPPTANTNVFLKIYAAEENVSKILNDLWIKKYAVELSRLQWGDNLSKYTAVSLPGGAQFNYDGILARAKEEIEKLKEELEDRFGIPLDPEYG